MSVFTLLNQRISGLESTVANQQHLIMDLSYQLDSKEKGSMLPFISGKFGYGLGRPAVRRKVLLFANRAQFGAEEEAFPTTFLGQYQTDGNGTLGPVPVPESLVTTPGHYNVLALLPQDNTFARGSLFILKPGTKCVLFDLDGTITVCAPFCLLQPSAHHLALLPMRYIPRLAKQHNHKLLSQ
jgi:hypothetical protein